MNPSDQSKRSLVCAKEVAQACGVSYAAVNNYTDMGLLEVVCRKKRLRMYDLEECRARLDLIVRLVGEGYTLRIIAKLLQEGKLQAKILSQQEDVQ